MVDELIDQEKRKLLVKLEEYEKLKKDLKQIDEQMEKLSKQIHNLATGLEMPMSTQNFNIFQKIFSKKYKEYKEKLKVDEAKRRKDGQTFNEKKNLYNNLQIEEETKKKAIDSIEKEKIKNEINILADREKAIIKILELYPEKYKDLMEELIDIDPRYIRFDKTDDPDLYMKIFDKMETDIDIDSEYGREFLPLIKNIKNIINQKQNNVDNGKYAIPLKYLFEDIRKQMVDQFKMEKSCTYKLCWYEYALNSICSFDELNGKFQDEFGKKIQEMYEDENNILVAHGVVRGGGTNPNYFEEFGFETVDSIMKQGLRATNAMGELSDGFQRSPDLSATAMINNNNDKADFFTFLNYDYDANVGYFLFQVPKSGISKGGSIPIWGTDSRERLGGDREYYVLPEYIKGFVKTLALQIKPEDRIFEEKKDYTNDIKYKYKVFDYSVYSEVVFEDELEK